MSQTVFFLQLLLMHSTTRSVSSIEVEADCGADVSLRCPHDDIDSIDFLSVIWYKIDNQKKYGIAMRKRTEDKTSLYNLNCTAKIGDKFNLLLPNVTPENSGTYDCALNANIGGQNQNARINLTVHDCEPNTVSSLPTNTQAEDLPVLWSILGYVVVALVKILLSLICILVIRVLTSRPSKK